jgi:hypothetical protein
MMPEIYRRMMQQSWQDLQDRSLTDNFERLSATGITDHGEEFEFTVADMQRDGKIGLGDIVVAGQMTTPIQGSEPVVSVYDQNSWYREHRTNYSVRAFLQSMAETGHYQPE